MGMREFESRSCTVGDGVAEATLTVSVDGAGMRTLELVAAKYPYGSDPTQVAVKLEGIQGVDLRQLGNWLIKRGFEADGMPELAGTVSDPRLADRWDRHLTQLSVKTRNAVSNALEKLGLDQTLENAAALREPTLKPLVAVELHDALRAADVLIPEAKDAQ